MIALGDYKNRDKGFLPHLNTDIMIYQPTEEIDFNHLKVYRAKLIVCIHDV